MLANHQATLVTQQAGHSKDATAQQGCHSTARMPQHSKNATAQQGCHSTARVSSSPTGSATRNPWLADEQRDAVEQSTRHARTAATPAATHAALRTDGLTAPRNGAYHTKLAVCSVSWDASMHQGPSRQDHLWRTISTRLHLLGTRVPSQLKSVFNKRCVHNNQFMSFGELITFNFPTVVCNTLGVLNALRRDRESLIDLDHL